MCVTKWPEKIIVNILLSLLDTHTHDQPTIHLPSLITYTIIQYYHNLSLLFLHHLLYRLFPFENSLFTASSLLFINYEIHSIGYPPSPSQLFTIHYLALTIFHEKNPHPIHPFTYYVYIYIHIYLSQSPFDSYLYIAEFKCLFTPAFLNNSFTIFKISIYSKLFQNYHRSYPRDRQTDRYWDSVVQHFSNAQILLLSNWKISRNCPFSLYFAIDLGWVL